MKIFISQPMHGRTLEQIIEERNKAIEKIRNMLPGKYIEIINNLQVDEICIANSKKRPRLWYLGESIKLMSEADYIYFTDNNCMHTSHGCRIEYEVAHEYSIDILK